MFNKGGSTVPWKELTDEGQLDEIVKLSHEKPQLIFKHSTRCSISTMAKSRLERDWDLENVQPWYLSLLAHRDVSNAIASKFSVEHESPQAIVLKDGKVIYHRSHSAISVADLKKVL